MSGGLPSAGQPRPGEPSDLTRLAGLKLGNYRLERLVGRGRMGAVYLAKDEALLRPTAVKILAWQAMGPQGQDPVQWFLSEARLVARINHPRVVQIYGVARQGGHCYIAMEYVPGRSAGAAVAEDGPMAPELATDVLVQAASALFAAHRSGVVHRDVKPANLLMGAGSVTKLGDFGMALGLSDLPIGNPYLRVGTPYYTAPEIWRGEPACAASDIYSLGATYFHLLTGSPPFPGNEVAAVEQAHLRSPIPDPRERVPGIPAACAELVRRALAKSPRDRFASAQELAWEGRRVLQEVAGGAPVADRPAAALAEQEEPTPSPAQPSWAQALHLVRAPFADVDPAAPPYQGEPFSSVSALLASRAEEDVPVIALSGAAASGRTTLARRTAGELASTRQVLIADASGDASGAELMLRLGHALGAGAETDTGAWLELMVERLGEERRRGGRRPLVVVDGAHRLSRPLLALLHAARVTRSFQVMLVGAPDLVAMLERGGLGRSSAAVTTVEVPPLQREQVLAYLRSWLVATLHPHAPPLLCSPDALLLVALRSGGNLGRINRIAENMLALAAAQGRRTVTSFEAWTAPLHERWTPVPGAPPPRRPAGWPTPEAVRAIQACRAASGMRPWPGGEPSEAQDAGESPARRTRAPEDPWT